MEQAFQYIKALWLKCKTQKIYESGSSGWVGGGGPGGGGFSLASET